MNKITEDLQNEVQWELENNILPFWMNRMIDSEYGGFHGQITGNNQRVVHAPKGAILNARILWTFSGIPFITKAGISGNGDPCQTLPYR